MECHAHVCCGCNLMKNEVRSGQNSVACSRNFSSTASNRARVLDQGQTLQSMTLLVKAHLQGLLITACTTVSCSGKQNCMRVPNYW